jgi:holo-[acyl-carrier protein] synthase
MIIGTGVDMIETKRIARMIRRKSFPARIYTPSEAEACRRDGLGPKRTVLRLAGLFAAKEAVMKALGTGWTRGVAFSEIALSHTTAGQPQVTLSGKTKAIAQSMGVEKVFISISHTDDFALAFAILQGRPEK